MKLPVIKLPEKLEPFKGVILFAVILMLSNFFWKYNIVGDESITEDSTVTFWGLDVSAPFVWMAQNTANVTMAILHFFGSKVALESVNLLRYPNGNSVLIIWACTGLKQAYIFFCIIAFYRGSWIKKLWYIPSGLAIVYLFNILRIAVITALVENHPNWFDFLHLYFFKYLFYLIIFGMWIIWEENMTTKKAKSKFIE